MGLFNSSSTICYSVYSKSDDRFNFSGVYEGAVSCGIPDFIDSMIRNLESKYDCSRPDDLKFSCMKD